MFFPIVFMSVILFNKNKGSPSGTAFLDLFYCPCCSLSTQLLLFILHPLLSTSDAGQKSEIVKMQAASVFGGETP